MRTRCTPATSTAFTCRPPISRVCACSANTPRRGHDWTERFPCIEEHLALTYETPFFEANALAAAGLRGIPCEWRRGDLVVIRKMADCPRPSAINPRRKRTWQEL